MIFNHIGDATERHRLRPRRAPRRRPCQSRFDVHGNWILRSTYDPFKEAVKLAGEVASWPSGPLGPGEPDEVFNGHKKDRYSRIRYSANDYDMDELSWTESVTATLRRATEKLTEKILEADLQPILKKSGKPGMEKRVHWL
jgi:hypothetical protein